MEELVTPIFEEFEFRISGNRVCKRRKVGFFVYILIPTGVDIEECGIVSEKLSEKMDEAMIQFHKTIF